MIEMALSEMPNEFVIKSFLMANKAEAKSMCITEYNKFRALSEQYAEGRVERRVEEFE